VLFNVIINIGIIFCQDKKINNLSQFRPSDTCGSQKWNGLMPNFKHIITAIKNLENSCVNLKFIVTIVKIKIILATLWTKKYLIILLIDKLSLLNITGINEIIFNSKDTQIKNQFELNKAINGLKINITMDILKIHLLIYKG